MSNTTNQNKQKNRRPRVYTDKHLAQNNHPDQNHRNRNISRPAKKPSSLDPSLLVKEADYTEVEKVFLSDRLVKDLPINTRLREALAKKGYERPIL